MLGEQLKSMVGLIQLDTHGMQMKNPQIKDGPTPPNVAQTIYPNKMH